MASPKMHDEEFETDADLVRRLLRAQFPHWAELPIERVRSYGTDHAIYRLGDELSVRLPRIEWATRQPEREREWLPKLAPHLPLAIPVPLAIGEPGEGYPWRWLVSPWMRGQDATPEHVADLMQAARDLAAFLKALQAIDATDGPRPGRRNFYRGVPLAVRDENLRRSIPAWDGIVDTVALTAAWEEALAAPAWNRDPVWIHGDLMPGNLLANEGRLSAVIDFGCLGVGDPAADLAIGWLLFSSESRAMFKQALEVDDATWARGRGWALTGVGALPYYRDTNPPIVARARRLIESVLAEFASER
jgi:aminoglycoside phosphotransferase (APT) family kinase protein